MKRSREKRPPGWQPSITKMTEMIEEATVDAHDEGEQATGWQCAFDEHLELPFITRVLGVEVKVEQIDLRDDNSIVALCTRGRERQAISLIDLPLPKPPPTGSEWIAAYKYFCAGTRA